MRYGVGNGDERDREAWEERKDGDFQQQGGLVNPKEVGAVIMVKEP